MKGTSLGEFEELVLLAVGVLFDDAYGLALEGLDYQEILKTYYSGIDLSKRY